MSHLNINLIVGDVHLMALCSFIQNELEREVQRSTFEELQYTHPMTIKLQHKSVEEIRRDMQNLELQPPCDTKHIDLQKHVIQHIQEWCHLKLKDVILVTKIGG